MPDDTNLSREDEILVAALRALPREAELTSGEGEAMARVLRQRGLLGARGRQRMSVQAFALVAAVIAVVAFTGGIVAGWQWGTRHTVERTLAQPLPDVNQAAALVQRTGTLHAAALALLAEAENRGGGMDASPGAAVARAALRSAAVGYLQIEPDNRIARRMRAVLIDATGGQPTGPDALIWF